MINDDVIKNNIYNLSHYSQAIIIDFKEKEFADNKKALEILGDVIELFTVEPKKFDDKFYPLIIKNEYKPTTDVEVGLVFNRMLIDSCLIYCDESKLTSGYLEKNKSLNKYKKAIEKEISLRSKANSIATSDSKVKEKII